MENSDVDREDITLLQRRPAHVVRSMHHAVVHRQAGVRWKPRVRSRLVAEEGAFTLQVLQRPGDEGIHLRQSLSGLQPFHQSLMDRDDTLGRGSGAVDFSLRFENHAHDDIEWVLM